MPYEKGLKLDF